MSFEVRLARDPGDILKVEFDSPQSTKDGYSRSYCLYEIIGGEHVAENTGRLRFTFKGDRDNRSMIVVNEELKDAESDKAVFTPTHQQAFENGTKAVGFMKDDSQAGRLAVSSYFDALHPEFGFSEAELY